MSRYPIHWSNWRRLLRAIADTHGKRAVAREVALRGTLMVLNKRSWERDVDAQPPTTPPLMIVGHQRSGTTWLHRLLAGHPSATSMALHNLILPSDGWQKRFDRPRPEWLDRIQDRVFAPMDDIHRLRLHEPEEDAFINWPVVRSPTAVLDRPWPLGHVPQIEVDQTAMAFHAQVVARQHRRTGLRTISKNPHFSYRIPQIRCHMPTVGIIALWREPAQCIPSRLSLIEEVWRRRIPGFRTMAPHHVQWLLDDSKRTYLGALDGPDLHIRYQDLVHDPSAVVAAIHRHFGMAPLSNADHDRIQQTQRSGKTRHQYSLERFGLAQDTFDQLRAAARHRLD